MSYNKEQSIIESILFSAGRQVEIKELMSALELNKDEVISILQTMQDEYSNENRGIELIQVNDAYQLCTKKENYDYIYPIFDKRTKPNLSPAALEVLSIIAYNPKITKAELEAIRGVSSDGTIYRLLDYELIEEAGRLDAPGRPTMYKTSDKFLKMFGLTNLDELPELPKYKLDENQQIVIESDENNTTNTNTTSDDTIENNSENNSNSKENIDLIDSTEKDNNEIIKNISADIFEE